MDDELSSVLGSLLLQIGRVQNSKGPVASDLAVRGLRACDGLLTAIADEIEGVAPGEGGPRPPAFRPDWVVAPGAVLREALEERGMSQSELARLMGRPQKTINEIVNARAHLTPATALQLEQVLGISATFWVNMEVSYRLGLAKGLKDMTPEPRLGRK